MTGVQTCALPILSIPTLILFKDGQVADQIVGAVPKTKIDQMLKRAV